MKLSLLSPFEQSQLAAAIAGILAADMTDCDDITVLLLILSAVRDNVALYSQNIKKNAIVSK